MLVLKKPTPMPKKIKPRTKGAMAAWLGAAMTLGMAETMMRMWPSVATQLSGPNQHSRPPAPGSGCTHMAMLMVLYFPQYVSDM